MLDVGAGTGRVALELARAGHDVTALDLDAELLAALRERARARRARGRDRAADARASTLAEPPFGADRSCRCRRSSCCRRAAAPASSPPPRAHLAPGGLRRARDRRRARAVRRRDTALPLPGHRRARRLALRAPSRSRSARDGDGVVIERVRQCGSRPTAARTSEDDVDRARHARPPATLEAEGRAAGLAARAARATSPRPTSTSARRWCCSVADGVLRVCALYPDLMNIYADRGNLLLLERRCEWRGIGFELAGAGLGDDGRPRRRTTSSTSAAARTATSSCARRTSPTVKRDALHAAAERGARRSSPSAAATSCSATATSSAASGCRASASSTSRPCASDGPRLIGNVAIEVDLGRRPAGARRLREPRRPHAPRAPARSRSGAC